MSKKSNPTAIGGFVVGAVILLSVAVALFGGAELLAERTIYRAYFVEQTTGLRVGSNVLMNGVRVGFVSDIDLLVDQQTYNTMTRATMEILPDTFLQIRNGEMVGEAMSTDISHDELIYVGGLRAQLQVESFVTGQLLVELELLSDSDPVLRGGDSDILEIPTIPSSVQQLLARVRDWLNDVQQEFDIEEIGTRFASILVGVDELSNSQDLRRAISGLNAVMNHPETQDVTRSFRQAMEDLSQAAEDASALFNEASAGVDVLVTDLRPALTQLSEALNEAEQTLAAAKNQLRGDSEQIYQLESTLEQIEGAARALRDFFDYLERNPEALLRGKQP